MLVFLEFRTYYDIGQIYSAICPDSSQRGVFVAFTLHAAASHIAEHCAPPKVAYSQAVFNCPFAFH